MLMEVSFLLSLPEGLCIEWLKRQVADLSVAFVSIDPSPTPMLCPIMALTPCFAPQVSCLGIDDWSFRRGRKFGTILVDLATHTILDLLPFNHWSGRLHATRLQLPSPTHYQCIETLALLRRMASGPMPWAP